MSEETRTPDQDEMDRLGANSKKVLQENVERINNAMDQIDDLKEDMKVLYAGMKAVGFDTPALRMLIREMRKSEEKRKKEASLSDRAQFYSEALD